MAAKRDPIEVAINGQHFSMVRGIRLGAALEQANAFHIDGTLVAIGQRAESKKASSKRFLLSTGAGHIVLEVNPDEMKALWTKADLEVKASRIQSVDANAVSIGPFVAKKAGEYKEYQLDEGFAYADTSGMDPNNACLIISKKKHQAFYSLAQPQPIGRVVSGSEVLHDLTVKDKTINIERIPISEDELQQSYIATNDLEVTIERDGTLLHSCIVPRLSPATPESGEIFLSKMAEGSFEVVRSTGTLCASAGLDGLKIMERCEMERNEGMITIRNSGKGQGTIFFYKRPRPASGNHTVIGQIEEGMELLRLAREGDRVSIHLRQGIFNTIGLTQEEAGDLLSSKGMMQVREGDPGDHSVVVRQNPSSSLSMQTGQQVRTFGLPDEQIVKIRLLKDKAPVSIGLFRSATGLHFNRIGNLRVLFPYSSMVGAVLLGADLTKTTCTSLKPENTPKKKVVAGEIGITNSIKSRMGTVGIRIDESKEFGPTCETFEGTNVIGRTDKASIEKIKKIKGGKDLFFIVEDRSPSSPPRA